MSLWRPDRQDWRAMLLVALIPILLALPQFTPWLKADPTYYTASLTIGKGSVVQRGVPYIDPNNGFQTQALGYRAAKEWLRGQVPWWNPYSGIGMPLAAEYQPAAFFPLTFLVLLPRGMVFLQVALQLLCGVGTYVLLRQLGVGRLASFTGAAVYGVNGTLAWFAHGPASPVPFLPWFLYGIERAFVASAARARGGWRTIAGAMGLSLLAGFPETAYINGLLALAWATLRGMQLPDFAARSRFGARVAAGGITALAIASPQILAFAQYLPHTDVGGHDGGFATAHIGPYGAIASLGMPYAFGPPMGYGDKWEAIFHHWGILGGYVTFAVVAVAIYGFLVARTAPAWLLAAWIVTTLAKTFGIEPFQSLWNLVPGVTQAAFARYAQPSWELAFAMLAAFGIDHAVREAPRRGPLLAAALVPLALWLLATWPMSVIWPKIVETGGLSKWTLVSFAWAFVMVAAAVSLIAMRRTTAAAILLVADAALMCFIPTLSNPASGRIDTQAVEFLRRNLGLQRFYTFEPIQPNYGAYFGIASINHNYLPVPQAWVDHIRKHLDRRWGEHEGTVFNGLAGSARDAFRANLAAYENLGVKYVVSPLHSTHAEELPGVSRVYDDEIIKIFQLPDAKPYFETPDAACRVFAGERLKVRLECPQATTLVRRELYFPGWSAKVNGTATQIKPRDEIFQSVAVPQGASEVVFRYAPPHIGWAWAAMWLGLAALAAPSLLLLRRKHQ